MKSHARSQFSLSHGVTPHAGVWIEILLYCPHGQNHYVTPHAGVWIEIWKNIVNKPGDKVTPHAGVWIEISRSMRRDTPVRVTPHAGVWIEIVADFIPSHMFPSLPMRECGLKSSLHPLRPLKASVTPHAGVWIEICSRQAVSLAPFRHSPCGSVD